jgi:GntR family transcriptional regulator
MLLHLVEYSSEPLHVQITRQIRSKILSGGLHEDAPLPSIRGLAREHRVSVITVQRAYEELEREGLVNSRRGKGFFVKALGDRRKRDIATDGFRRKVASSLAEAMAGGLSSEEIMRVVRELLKRKGDEK